MRIALIGDIHSNQFAFEAVLNNIKSENIDQIIFLGDYAFGGCGSVEVVDILMNYKNHPYIAIKGNKEEYITPIEAHEDWPHPVLFHIYNELGSKRNDFLKSLPTVIDISIEGIPIKVCHSPAKQKVFTVVDRLRRNGTTPNKENLSEIAKKIDSEVCIFGHYHLFMDEVVDGKRFICAGSVGLPLDGDPKAKYMILEIENSVIMTTQKSVIYDRCKLVDDFESKGYFEKFDVWSMNTLVTMMTGCNYIGTQDLRRK